MISFCNLWTLSCTLIALWVQKKQKKKCFPDHQCPVVNTLIYEKLDPAVTFFKSCVKQSTRIISKWKTCRIRAIFTSFLSLISVFQYGGLQTVRIFPYDEEPVLLERHHQFTRLGRFEILTKCLATDFRILNACVLTFLKFVSGL